MLNQDIAVWKCFKQISGFQTESCLDFSLILNYEFGLFSLGVKMNSVFFYLHFKCKNTLFWVFLDFYSMFIIEIVPLTVAVDTTSSVIRPIFSHEVKIRTRSLHLRDSSLILKFKLWPDLSLSFNIHTIILTHMW